MARETGPQCKQCRREGQKLFLKGERCLTDKCGVERRAYPPGDHGRGRQKQSEYRVQLREKQKARRYYGVLEKQFRHYYEKASNQPGITGENLLQMLETRLDNVLVRLGFAASRRQARSARRSLVAWWLHEPEAGWRRLHMRSIRPPQPLQTSAINLVLRGRRIAL